MDQMHLYFIIVSLTLSVGSFGEELRETGKLIDPDYSKFRVVVMRKDGEFREDFVEATDRMVRDLETGDYVFRRPDKTELRLPSEDLRGYRNLGTVDRTKFKSRYQHLRDLFPRETTFCLTANEIDRMAGHFKELADFLPQIFSIYGSQEDPNEMVEDLEFLSESLRRGDPPALLKPKHELPESLSGSVLMVTHATRNYDQYGIIKRGLDALIQKHQQRDDAKLFFLVEEGPNSRFAQGYSLSWYSSQRNPDYIVISGGAHDLKVQTDEVTFAGGSFGACLQETVESTILNHRSSSPLTLNFPMRAIYCNFSETLYDSFRKQKDAKAFIQNTVMKDMYFDIAKNLAGSGYHRSKFDLSRDYTFEFFVDGEPVQSVGSGSKKIRLRFLTPAPK